MGKICLTHVVSYWSKELVILVNAVRAWMNHVFACGMIVRCFDLVLCIMCIVTCAVYVYTVHRVKSESIPKEYRMNGGANVIKVT